MTLRHGPEDAAAAGERFVGELALGDAPATRLARVMERHLGALVLMVDLPEGVSAGACRLPALDTVRINRGEPLRGGISTSRTPFSISSPGTRYRRQHVADGSERSRKRVERLANSFALGLLMPAAVLDRLGPWTKDTARRLNRTANACSDGDGAGIAGHRARSTKPRRSRSSSS